MRVGMKIVKGIFFGIAGLLMAGGLGGMICALNPSLTAMLAEKVENMTPAQSGGTGGTGDGSGRPQVQPGVNADWMDGRNGVIYEPPGSQSVEVPSSVSGRTGYEPVKEDAQQVDGDEADNLAGGGVLGNTGDGLNFDGEYYPYYAMLETDLQQLYRQIYANATELKTSFAPVIPVTVAPLKNVFEAVYNDHPELFWLETGYSCKYLTDGSCVEITLKYNGTAGRLEEARQDFESRAGAILSEARNLGSDAEKEKFIHDKLMEAVEYSVGAPMNQSAYSALVDGQSVCAGYARAFQYLMQRMGIPCYYCTGYAGEDHAWNIVSLDGGYRNVDVTWDDTDTPTYDYFNKTDRELNQTHVRTGLSVYLPACLDGSEGDNSVQDTGNSGENPPSEEQEEGGKRDPSSYSLSELINPNPTKPMSWQSKTPSSPSDNGQAEAERIKQENLAKAGITEEQVRDTMKEYYDDCRKLLKEAGVGDKQFYNVVPESLWNTVERAYSTGDYWKGYAEAALKDLGVENLAIQIQIQALGGGYYRVYHNVYTY